MRLILLLLLLPWSAALLPAGEATLTSPLHGRSFDLKMEPVPGRPVPPRPAGMEKDPDAKLRFVGPLAVLSTPTWSVAGSGLPKRTYMIVPVTIKPQGRNAIVDGSVVLGPGFTIALHAEIVGAKIAGTFTNPGDVTKFAGKDGEPDLPADEQLERARDLELRREPKRAIALYAQLVEEHRYEPWISAPALIGWWDCHRALKGDAKAERDFAERANRWLSQPPPLTGDPPSQETASEDLLWKAWLPTLPGAKPEPAADTAWRPAFTVKSAERQSSTWEGKTTKTLQVQLEATPDAGMNLVAARSLGGKDPAIDATLVVGDARLAPIYSSMNAMGGRLYVSLSFPEPPKGAEKAALAGTIALSQPVERTVTRVPLRNGATWKTAEGEATITACEIGDGSCKVSYRVQGSGGHGSSISSGSSSGGGMMIDENAPNRVVGKEGLAVAPNSSSCHSSDDVANWNLAFATPFVPTELLVSATGKLSTRTVPLTVADIDLP
jgi:hypothetical protein